MSIKNNIEKEVAGFRHIAENEHVVGEKLEELIQLLERSDINSEKAKEFKRRFDNALDHAVVKPEAIKAFNKLDIEHSSREELLDEFSILLSSNQFDSKTSKKYLKGERSSKIVLIVISLVMITLGFAMIIMPAPPYFEMFTIFYFNPNDGVTLMDLISLLIILAGIFFLIKGIYRNPAKKK